MEIGRCKSRPRGSRQASVPEEEFPAFARSPRPFSPRQIPGDGSVRERKQTGQPKPEKKCGARCVGGLSSVWLGCFWLLNFPAFLYYKEDLGRLPATTFICIAQASDLYL
uniref:uncharacterized protein LOC114605925 isoform X3 n=1 Tax=Podarcis muralis TaxID=64176 RepID=UPI00109F6CAA|nr:uncharacterized protein LOC114605925 isoform X3 [Podarcis muralis]